MALIGTLLDAHYNAAHMDHVHVEPPTKMRGTPPTTNPGMTDGIKAIYNALEDKFGPGAYFLDRSGRYVGNDPGVYWTHMGGWNRRYIGSGTTWSQHAWWNALDIGPYVGADAQKKFVDFLTGREGEEDMAFSPHEEAVLKQFVSELDQVNSNPTFLDEGRLIADIRKNIVTMDELNAKFAAIPVNEPTQINLNGKTLVVEVKEVR